MVDVGDLTKQEDPIRSEVNAGGYVVVGSRDRLSGDIELFNLK